MKATEAIDKLQRELKQYQDQLTDKVGIKAVKFFQEGFLRQGWVEDGRLERWKPRKNNSNAGKGILLRSGLLMGSLKYVKEGFLKVRIGSELPYAPIHNEGGIINATQHVRPFTRKNGSNVRGFSRKVIIEMPQRKFLGESADVYKSAERELIKDIESIINNLK
jgi:phage gpG-like protein